MKKLSSLLQTLYLGPIVNSCALKRRLRETTEFIAFVHDVNTYNYIIRNKIVTPPNFCAIDIKNISPSIFNCCNASLIMQRLLANGFSRDYSKAVVEALEIVRDGTRVMWRDEVIRQRYER